MAWAAAATEGRRRQQRELRATSWQTGDRPVDERARALPSARTPTTHGKREADLGPNDGRMPSATPLWGVRGDGASGVGDEPGPVGEEETDTGATSGRLLDSGAASISSGPGTSSLTFAATSASVSLRASCDGSARARTRRRSERASSEA
jgi:hypothetical protein